jgi:hypothetical protein
LCKSLPEINEVVNNMVVQVPTLNFIFNVDTYKTNPIESKILTDAFNIQESVALRAVYLLKRNEAILRDNWLTSTFGEANYTSYETSLRQMSIPKADENNPLLTYILGMND